MRYFYLLNLFLISILAWSQPQNGLVAYYPFENCDAKDVSLNNSDGIVFGEPECGCGVLGNALYLDGVDDYAAITGNVETYFRAARFTLSFYFRIDDASGTHDILSKRSGCNFDHSFSVRYTPASHTLGVDIAESADVRTTFNQKIDPSLCWVNLVIVKDKQVHRIYINGVLIASQTVPDFLDISNSSPIHIANSPCIATTDRRFKGFIDEMRVYNRILDDEEIKDLYLSPDRIISNDTTIYQGGTATLVAGPSCAQSISGRYAEIPDHIGPRCRARGAGRGLFAGAGHVPRDRYARSGVHLDARARPVDRRAVAVRSQASAGSGGAEGCDARPLPRLCPSSPAAASSAPGCPTTSRRVALRR